MKKKHSKEIRDSYEIEHQLMAVEEIFSVKVKIFLLRALSRSYQLIHIVEGKETAIKLIWQYLRPREDFPPKKITDKQKERVSGQMKELVEFNNALKEVYRDSMPKELAEIQITFGLADFSEAYGPNLLNEPDKVRVFLEKHGAYGSFFLNDWEGMGYSFIDNFRDRFLYDYLNSIEDFSDILFDEKALMCASDDHAQLPTALRGGPFSERIKEFCYLFAYAYLGILPSGKAKFVSAIFEPFLSLEGIDIKRTSPDSFIEYIFNQTSNSIEIFFGKNIPKFFEAGIQAAKCRLNLDRGLPVSANNLSKLAGVDRKSIVNAKLSKDTNSISAEKALDFLSQKARNRWMEKDEDGDPIGLKMLHIHTQFGINKNFYPSVEKLKVKPITSKEK